MRYRNLGGQNLKAELDNLRRWTEQPTVPFLYLDMLTAAPARPSNGMMVYADGVTWNPGAGVGFYRYDGAAWNFLG